MDKVVNWFLLLIVFVFDPLAIALIVAANMAFAQIRKPKDDTEGYFEKRNEHLDKVVMSVPKGMEFNRSYPIPSEDIKQRVKENQEKLNKDLDINTYGEDDWATPPEEEVITLDGGEIEVTVEPSEEQLKDLYGENDLNAENKRKRAMGWEIGPDGHWKKPKGI